MGIIQLLQNKIYELDILINNIDMEDSEKDRFKEKIKTYRSILEQIKSGSECVKLLQNKRK